MSRQDPKNSKGPKFIEISSATNARFRELTSLGSGRGLRKSSHFLYSGRALIEEYLAEYGESEVVACLRTSDMPSPTQGALTYLLSKELFHEIDTLGTHSPILLLKQKLIPDVDLKKTKEGFWLICPLGDPSNLGALLRSLVSFGESKVILTEEAAHPYLPKALKASAGAAIKCDFYRGPSLKELSSLNLPLTALDMEGTPLHHHSFTTNTLLVVGEEGPGLGSLRAKYRVQVPTAPKLNSLNATVAASIYLYEHYNWSSRRAAKGLKI